MAAPDRKQRFAEFAVPAAGVIRGLPAEVIAPGGLFDADNVLVRRGVLRARPGLRRNPYSQAGGGTGIPTGAFWYTNEDGSQKILIGTTTGIYAFDGATWQTLTAPVAGAVPAQPSFSGTLRGSVGDHPSRFTSIQSGTTVWVLHTNGVDPMLMWDGHSAAFTTVSGLPVGPASTPGDPVPAPIFSTILTVEDHILGLLPPYAIQWGRNVSLAPNLDQWPQLNFRNLADTPDVLVTAEALGTLGLAVYKTDTIWLGQATGGSEASAFSFTPRGFYEGPASAGAVINSTGFHLYMTATGRVGTFDGSEHRWVADPVWPLLVDGRPDDPGVRMHPFYADRTFGVINKLFREAWFFYPRIKDTDGLPRGVIILSLPDPQPDYLGTPLQVKGAFPGSLSALWGGAVTTGLHYRLTDPGPHLAVFGSTGAKDLFDIDMSPALEVETDPAAFLAEGETRDDGIPFGVFWQFPLVRTPGKATLRMAGVEPFFEREVGYGWISLKPVRSYALDSPGGDVGDPVAINLEQREVRPVEAFDVRGRWFSVRFEYVPTSQHPEEEEPPTLRFHGVDLFGYQVEG